MKLRTIKTKLPKSIKRIIILKADEKHSLGGSTDRIVVRKKGKKKKKQTKGINRIFERLARRSSKANALSSKSYLKRHRRSNRKHRDGWLRDFSYNVTRSRRKGGKEFKLSKLFKW